MQVQKCIKKQKQWYFRASCLFALTVLSICLKAQQYNLVPNPSFEQYSSCPSTATLYEALNSKPDYWYKPDKRGAAYFNICSTTGWGVPYNISTGGTSYQYARTGVGYIGICYMNGQNNNGRCYFQVKMLDSLKSGKCYYVDFFVSLYNSFNYACNNISLLFTNNPVYVDTAMGAGMLPANPQVMSYGNPVIIDTLNWVKVSAVFTAQGGEQYLTLGNFRDFSQTSYQQFQTAGGYNAALYYIDDVSVIPLDSLPLQADAGPDRTISNGSSTYIGSYTNGLNNTVWYNSAGTVIATNVPGLTVTPAASTFYVLQQTVCGYTSRDTVYVNVGIVPLSITGYSLSSLRGTKQSVLNSWTTTNETNVSHFNIQRSSDGSSFQTIAKAAAQNGTSNSYQFTDEHPLNGTSYYRLEAVDKDGKTTYSKVLSIAISHQPLAVSIYPNPAKDFVTISYPKIKQVSILDIAGRVVIAKEYQSSDGVKLDIGALGKGIYLVRVSGNGNSISTQKLVIE